MKRKNATSAVVLIVILAAVGALYISWGPPQATSAPSAENQKVVADLKKQITVLEERVNELEVQLAQGRTHKPSPL